MSRAGRDVVLRGVRVIDPLAGVDARPRSVLVRAGRIEAIDRRVDVQGAVVVDLTPRDGAPWVVVSPAFIDLHAHLREPGEEEKETVATGGRAAAAGGFGQIVAMANTKPTVDTPAEVGRVRGLTAGTPVRVLVAAAVSRGLEGVELADIRACAAAGAAAFSDDGRNALTPRLMSVAIGTAEEYDRAVLVHPEDEAMVTAANPGATNVARCPLRPAACEVAAVDNALRALVAAGRGRLHLQHLSATGAVDSLRSAREEGLAVTAEVTPHHLAMWRPLAVEPEPPSLAKVNPPLRSERDREAVVQALREGIIDCVATDHAPHTVQDKAGEYAGAAPGMIGLETAFAVCNTLGGMGDAWLPVLVERLTAGPWRALGEDAGLSEPRLRAGERATLTVFDPDAEWIPAHGPIRSLSRNSPFLDVPLRGRVLLTLVDGAVAYVGDDQRLLAAFAEAVPVA